MDQQNNRPGAPEARITADWLGDPVTQDACRVLTRGGFRALFVGGAVRNALLGVPANDLDIATDARPYEVMAIAGKAGVGAVPTGIEHGTVTLVLGGSSFEVTSLRRDVANDGRRAVVAFTRDIAEDARRRDLTINALYADPEGRVVDLLGASRHRGAARPLRWQRRGRHRRGRSAHPALLPLSPPAMAARARRSTPRVSPPRRCLTGLERGRQ